MGRSRQLSLNKFFDPSAPSMRNVDDGKKEKKEKKEKIMSFLVATNAARSCQFLAYRGWPSNSNKKPETLSFFLFFCHSSQIFLTALYNSVRRASERRNDSLLKIWHFSPRNDIPIVWEWNVTPCTF